MRATEYVFFRPKSVATRSGPVVWPKRITLDGHRVPQWLKKRLAKACARVATELVPNTETRIHLVRASNGFGSIKDTELQGQAYKLEISKDGATIVRPPGESGLQWDHHALPSHGIVGAGARLSPVVIRDVPAFKIRGIQIDLGREYFPPLLYLKRIIDRMVDLKLNTPWLYFENRTQKLV